MRGQSGTPSWQLRLTWQDSALWTGLLVEREHCGRVVDQAAHDLVEGRSSVLLVHAPPGGGLTTVLEMAAMAARSRGATTVWVRCSADESGVRFGAAAQVLAALGVDEHGLSGLDRARSAVNVVPHLTRALLGVARERPMAMLVDDVQWIDADSAELLVAVARRATHAPLLVVVGNGVPSAPSSLVTMLRDGSGGARVRELTPAPLGREGITRLLAAACPARPDVTFVEAVLAHTGGCPAVVRRVLVSLAHRSVPPAAAVVPEVPELAALAWQELVERRIEAVPAPARRLLRAVAVCHGVFDLRNAAVVAGLGSGYTGVADLLTTAGLLVGDMLPNEVVAELVLALTSRAEREELHAAAAELAYRTALPDDVVAGLLEGAAPLGRSWVPEVLRNAAATARRRGEHRDAVRLLERALAEPLSSGDRAALLVDCGAAETPHAPDAGERKLATVLAGAAGGHRLAAAELILARGNSELVRRAARSDRALAALYWMADEARHEDPELVPMPRPPIDDEPADAAGAAWAAWAVVTAGRDIGHARRHARAALAGPIGPAPLLLPWIHAARALGCTGDHLQATAALDAIIIESRRRGLPALTGWALVARAKAFLRQGLLGDAELDLDRAAVELPPASWHPAVQPVFTSVRLGLALETRRFDDAARVAATTFPADSRTGFNWVQFEFTRALLALVVGDHLEAAALFEECGRALLARRWRNPALLPWRSFGAVAHARGGRADDAARLAAEEVRLAERWGEPRTTDLARHCAALVEPSAEVVAVPVRYAAVLADLRAAG